MVDRPDVVKALVVLAVNAAGRRGLSWDWQATWAACATALDTYRPDRVLTAIYGVLESDPVPDPSSIGAALVGADVAPPKPAPLPPEDPNEPRCSTCGRSQTRCRAADEKLPEDLRHEFSAAHPRGQGRP